MVVEYTKKSDIDFLIKLVKDSKMSEDSIIVEIGTANLGTTIHLAKATPNAKIVTIDTYTSPKVSFDDYEKNLNTLKEFNISNVVLVCSTSEYLGKVFSGKIDFLWIDGFHDYEFVKSDIRLWGKKLKRGCTISGHDYTGHNKNVTRAVNELIKDSSNYTDFNVFNKTIWYAKRK